MNNTYMYAVQHIAYYGKKLVILESDAFDDENEALNFIQTKAIENGFDIEKDRDNNNCFIRSNDRLLLIKMDFHQKTNEILNNNDINIHSHYKQCAVCSKKIDNLVLTKQWNM